MHNLERIGVIGGNGWLGSALIRAAVAGNAVDPRKMTVSSRSGSREALAGLPVYWTHDNAELARRSDVVILSVRSAQFNEIDVDLHDKFVVSVMAGVPCSAIRARTGASRIVRSMPNAAAAISQSFTPWFATAEARQDEMEFVRRFLGASGEAAEVRQESHIDYCVGLTGSGAAFPALLAEALIAEAVAQGVPRGFAIRAAKGVLCGASQLFKDEGADTAAIVRDMIDYRGTTAAALQAMLAHGFNDAVASGLRAAAEKAATIAQG